VIAIALDRNPAVLQAARDWSAGFSELRFVLGDVTRLPVAVTSGGPVDLTVCANTLHHLDPAQLAEAIAGLAAVTRRRLVVSDLRRSAWNARLFPWLARVLGLHPMSRFDGQLSLRHALSATELATAARAAGLDGCRVRHDWLRVELVWDRPDGALS
jgi:hypothetical protein